MGTRHIPDDLIHRLDAVLVSRTGRTKAHVKPTQILREALLIGLKSLEKKEAKLQNKDNE